MKIRLVCLVLVYFLFSGLIFAKSAVSYEPVYDTDGNQIGNNFVFDDGTTEFIPFNGLDNSVKDYIDTTKDVLDSVDNFVGSVGNAFVPSNKDEIDSYNNSTSININKLPVDYVPDGMDINSKYLMRVVYVYDEEDGMRSPSRDEMFLVLWF